MAASEPDELAGVSRPGLFLLTVPGIEDGLSGLAGDTAGQGEPVQIEMVAFAVTQNDQAKGLILQSNRGNEE
jgi:hypothetical protein